MSTFIETYQKVRELSAYHADNDFFEKAYAIFTDFTQTKIKQESDEELEEKYKQLQNLVKSLTVADTERKIKASILKSKYSPAKPQFIPEQSSTIIIKPIEESTLPPQVAKADLQPNKLLLNQTQKERVTKELRSEKKQMIKVGKYSATLLENNCCVLYKTLGKGNFGEAYLAQDQTTGKWFVLKMMGSKKDIDEFFKIEIQNLKDFNLSRGILTDNKGNSIGVGLDYIQGVTLERLADRNLSAIHLLRIFIATLEGAHEFHETMSAWHGDIKPDNIIYNENTEKAKLIDAGLATKKDKSHENVAIGCTLFLAPEIMSGKNAKTEMFACGRTFFALLVESLGGELEDEDRINDDNDIELWSQYIIKNAVKLKMPQELLEAMLHYIKQLMHSDPKQRPTNFKEAIKIFKALESDCLALFAKFRNNAIVLLDELTDDQGELCDQFIKPLALYDRVWIFDPNNQIANKNIHINKLRTQLAEHGVSVADVLQPVSKDKQLKTGQTDIESIKNYIETRTAGFINNYFYVTEKQKPNLIGKNINVIAVDKIKNLKAYQAEIVSSYKITDYHYDQVVESLFKEIARLEIKLRREREHENDAKVLEVLEQRITAIKNTMQILAKKFQSHDKSQYLTYKNLHEELHSLQNKMCHTNKYKHFLFSRVLGLNPASMGLFAPKGVKNIQKPQAIKSPVSENLFKPKLEN